MIARCGVIDCTCSRLHYRPTFDVPCRRGMNCQSPNCYYTHPMGWKVPPVVATMCALGFGCKDPMCVLMHPECKNIKGYIKKANNVCRFGKSCKNQLKCGRSGHDVSPPRCRNGPKCPDKGGVCIFDHTPMPGYCRYGSTCFRVDSCWYAIHDHFNVGDIKNIQPSFDVPPEVPAVLLMSGKIPNVPQCLVVQPPAVSFEQMYFTSPLVTSIKDMNMGAP